MGKMTSTSLSSNKQQSHVLEMILEQSIKINVGVAFYLNHKN